MDGRVYQPDEWPLQVVSASSVELRSIEWIDRPLVQGSAFTLLAGKKGLVLVTGSIYLVGDLLRII